MGDVIQFRPKRDSGEGEEIPYLTLCDSISDLLDRAIEIGLVSQFYVTDIEGDFTDGEPYKLYKIIIELPDGKKAQFEQPSLEVLNFLNGFLLGAYLTENSNTVRF